MKDVVFTSYAFGELYCYQQMRLKESILKIYPDANIMFWHSIDGSSSNNNFPPGSPTFHESMYGFKVHCVKNCIKAGFKKVVFLDAAMILEEPIESVMKKAEEIGVLVVGENTELKTVISDRCLEYVGIKREDLNLTLVGGSVYIFDFTNPVAVNVFNYWAQMEADGIFGNEVNDCRGLLQGHRKDETCMALALDKYGLKPLDFDTVGYHNLGSGNVNRKFTFYKLHFKGIGTVHGHSFNQSIIPMHGNILDLGCRDFEFSNFFKELEYNVVSVDIGMFEGDYHRVAISDMDGWCYVQNERDPDATHITSEYTGERVPMKTIETFSSVIGVNRWDLIKMDIEGAEYGILKNSKHPLASQISVEFHAHCGQTKQELDELLEYLSDYYFIYNREWKDMHCCGFNYWDVLLIAK